MPQASPWLAESMATRAPTMATAINGSRRVLSPPETGSKFILSEPAIVGYLVPKPADDYHEHESEDATDDCFASEPTHDYGETSGRQCYYVENAVERVEETVTGIDPDWFLRRV